MVILDGEKISQKIFLELKNEIKEKQLKLTLAVVLIGESGVSKAYIKKKKEACENIGINFKFVNFNESDNEELIIEGIKNLASDLEISGIVVQLPIPKNFDNSRILNLLPIEKDPDILSDISFQKFEIENGFLPPVAGAVKKLLEEYDISLADKKVCVIGKGKLVGKPIAVWLKNNNMNFEVIDRSVLNLSEILKNSDVIISGAGAPHIVKSIDVKDGAILIDAGTSSDEGIVVGDIDKDAYEKASFVAPVPGGVGPVAIAYLLKNLVDLNK